MRKLNRVLALAVSSVVLVAGLAACGGDTGTTTTPGTDGAGETTGTEDTNGTDGTVEEGDLLTGLGVVTAVGSSSEAGDSDGRAQVDSTAVAVLVDADGVIVDVEIDAAQTRIDFDNTGALTTDLGADQRTKKEQGDDYNMRGNSGIDAEWFEQIESLEDLIRGNTLDEVLGFEQEDGKLVDATSSVTITVTGYLAALEKAVDSAEALGASEGDTVALGIETYLDGSYNYGENERAAEQGQAEAYSFYGVISLDSDDTITSAILDSSIGRVAFDATGQITTDLEAAQLTKNELGDEYGMRGNSDLDKEWNEQAAFFAESIVGKTVAEVSDISIDEGGYATDADLLSGVTIHINELISVVERAVAE